MVFHEQIQSFLHVVALFDQIGHHAERTAQRVAEHVEGRGRSAAGDRVVAELVELGAVLGYDGIEALLLLRRGKQPLAGIGRNGIVAVDEQDVVSRCGVDRHVARRRLAPVGLVEHLDVCVALGIAVTQLTRTIG